MSVPTLAEAKDLFAARPGLAEVVTSGGALARDGAIRPLTDDEKASLKDLPPADADAAAP